MSDRRRIYVDTNIFAFAHQDKESESAALLEFAASGFCTVIASDALLDEAAELFRRLFGPEHSNAVRRLLVEFPHRRYLVAAEWEREVEHVRPFVRDRDDLAHVAAALAGRADVLVSYNRRSVFGGVFDLVPLAAPDALMGYFRRAELWPTAESLRRLWEEWAKTSPRGPRATKSRDGRP